MVRRPYLAILPLLLLALTLFAHHRALSCGFLHLDDPAYVTANPLVSNGLTLPGVKHAFLNQTAANWHPLTMLSLMADAHLFGLNPRAFHATNLALHSASVLALFLFLRSLTRSALPCAFVAALLAVHPIHVESVAWIAQRKDVLCLFFSILTLWSYASWTRSPSLFRYLLTLVCFIAALTSKPAAVSLPILMLCLDLWPLQRFPFRAAPHTPLPSGEGGSERSEEPGEGLHASGASIQPQPHLISTSFLSLLLEKIPFILLSAALCLITLLAQRAGSALTDISLRFRLENALVSYALYLKRLLYPHDLNVMHTFPSLGLSRPWPTSSLVISALAILVITIAALALLRRAPFILAGWIWYLFAMLPMIGLVSVGDQASADRYAYLPFIGLYILLAFSVSALLRACARSAPRAAPPLRALVASIALAALLASAFTTRAHYARWKDSLALYNRALAVNPDNWIIHYFIAGPLSESGNLPLAISHLESAVRINPAYARAWYFLGDFSLKSHNPRRAVEALEHAVSLDNSIPGVRA